MHFKSLHNFLLIVLCTIGIGFVSAPPASAAQIMLIDGSTQTDITNKYRYFTADKAYKGDGTKEISNIEGTGYRSITVLATGFSGSITTSVTLTPQNQGPNIVNEFKVIKQNGNVYTIYYIPVTASKTYSKTRITFTDGTNSAYTDLWARYDNVDGSWTHASPQIAGISAPWGAGANTTNPSLLFNCDSGAGKTAITTKGGSYTREIEVTALKGNCQVKLIKDNDNSDFTFSPEVLNLNENQTGKFSITYTPTKEDKNNKYQFKVECGGETKTFNVAPTISAANLPGTITLDKSVFDLTANSSNPDWTNNGRIVDYLTVTGSGINGNITLSVSPQGNYGLTVTPTVLPAEGGTVTIIYKPQTGDAIHTSPYPVLSVKADNATTKTAELRTTWDNSTVTEGVTAVPDIPAGTFDPDIYECKTFTGRTTVSLRWEPKNPNDIKLKSYTQKQISDEANLEKKSWMVQWNTAYNNYTAMTYTLFRDGKEIVSDLDITSYVDMNVPVGEHKYYVVAHYRNGTRTASSAKQTVTVERDMAITNYVLEEIYNYPIVDEATYNNLTDKDKSFKAFGTDGDINRAGFLYKYNNKGIPEEGGAPGDGVRQAVFRDGKWYIAMVSNTVSSNGSALGYGIWTTKFNTGDRGRILEIGANGINNNPLSTYADLRVMSNQSLALTEDPGSLNFFFRGCTRPFDEFNNGKLIEGERYFEPITHFGGLINNSKTITNWPAASEIKTEADAHKAIAQYYRTHYMAARGKVAEGTGKLCFAQNESHDAYIVDLNNSGEPTAYHKISAPRQAVINHAGKQHIIDIDAGTENYIFPVEGEPNKYIHVMRSSGIFLVDVTNINNPVYTLISSDQSEVTSASGLTFTLKNSIDNSTDLFYIHGTSIYSNNTGHFRIDMPQRTMNNGKYTGDISTANFSDMVPMASKLQDAIPGFDAGNSNGMWFGTEDATEDGIDVKYIYQYVPGVRFAKYKFYPVQAFPPAQPTIDVVIRHDNPDKDAAPHEADDITHFDIAYQWNRPANFGTLQGAAKNFKIDGYNYELLDPNGNVLDKGYVAAKAGEDDNTVYGSFYYNQHKPTAGGKIDFSSYNPETAGKAGIYDVHDGKYTIRVTPVYVSTSDADRKYTGETGLAQDEANYTPEILNIRAKLFQSKNLYRVDIDFNRAPRSDGEASFANPGGKEYTFYKGDGVAANHKLAEPASRFKLEVSKNGGKTWEAIDNLRVFYDGKILINENNITEKTEIDKINANITANKGEIHSGTHDGFIKHDYNFGGNFTSRSTRAGVKARAAGQLHTNGDKMYVQEAIAHLYGDVSTVDQKVLEDEKNKGAFQAVAYHMIDASSMTNAEKADIRNWKYRATALYADNQPYASIKRSASVETTLGDPTTTGVEDAIADAAEGVHIWPVPAESELHIAAGEAIESVSIYNISGSCVASFEGNGDTTMTVSVDNLASGVYFVKVNANAAQRLIKR